jgi:hypothetical protein
MSSLISDPEVGWKDGAEGDLLGKVEVSREEEMNETSSPMRSSRIPQTSIEDEERILAAEVDDFQEDFPKGLGDRRFQDIDELQDALEELGCPDERFKIDDNGFAVKPGPHRNRATWFIHEELNMWSREILGRWGVSSTDNVMQINGVTAAGRTKQREPDVAFWSYMKCTKAKDGRYKVKQRAGSDFDQDPDIVFQFSNENWWANEVAVLNDVMQRGGVGAGNEGPKVGFLIKVNKSAGVAVGLDIYKVYNGCTVADAINGGNGCAHSAYTPGQPDAPLEITPEDFGFDGFWALICPNFKLSMSVLWDKGSFA